MQYTDPDYATASQPNTTELYLHEKALHAECAGPRVFIVAYVQAYDRLCGLEIRVPGYITEMYCASCEVRTEFIYVM
jgi:hypothetical protein